VVRSDSKIDDVWSEKLREKGENRIWREREREKGDKEERKKKNVQGRVLFLFFF